jgi:hypothetical protein
MIDSVEGVCPYTPPRVLTRITLKQEEITNHMQKIPYQFQKKTCKTLIYQEYSINMQERSLQEGSAPLYPSVSK